MRVLFERGAFTAVDTKATASMLAALALGLPAYVLVKVLHPSFFAREDTKTPMIYAGISLAANVVLSLMLFLLIGATGLALARRSRAGSMSLCSWPSLRAARALRSIASSAGASSASSRPARRWGRSSSCSSGSWPRASPLKAGSIVQVASLLALVGAGLSTYLGAAHLFGAAHFRDLIKDAGP